MRQIMLMLLMLSAIAGTGRADFMLSATDLAWTLTSCSYNGGPCTALEAADAQTNGPIGLAGWPSPLDLNPQYLCLTGSEMACGNAAFHPITPPFYAMGPAFFTTFELGSVVDGCTECEFSETTFYDILLGGSLNLMDDVSQQAPIVGGTASLVGGPEDVDFKFSITGGTYSLTDVPEPQSVFLLATFIVAIWMGVRRSSRAI